MNRDQKLRYNQQVRRSGLLVARFLRDVQRIPQALIDLILKDLKETLLVVPLRNLHLLLADLQMFALNPLDSVSHFRSYNKYYPNYGPSPSDPPTRTNHPVDRVRLGYGSFQ